MKYKMYLLHIGDLSEISLQEAALMLVDDYRQELVHKVKKEKDRMRAIAAGLLLQAGFMELDIGRDYTVDIETAEIGSAEDVVGTCKIVSAMELLHSLKEIGKIPLQYDFGIHGKPSWNYNKLKSLLPDKNLWHFNLSHSDEYVVLAIADCEVGVDIQKARKADRFPGGYQAFSRMESYVKCTGEGYAAGYKMYEQCCGKIPGYAIMCLKGIEGYAWHMCFELRV